MRRGEFLNGFSSNGLKAFGVDQYDTAKKYFPELNISIADFENEKLPFDNNYFEVIFSKSVVEHFYFPEKIVKEIFRVLKPGGIAIILTPDWHYNYIQFYEDYTHRTAFTSTSLKDILLIHNFKNVNVSKFKQLPILWNQNKLLSLLSEFTRVFAPNFLKNKSKWIVFKEIMLIASAIKPKI